MDPREERENRRRSTQEGLGNRPPAVPEGTRVYAVGDIHGRADLLMELQSLIGEDAGNFAGRRKVVVYVGDYVDRGPDSFEAIDRLVENPLEGFESVHLMGNHESFLIGFLEDPSLGPLWLMNGGDATLASYGVDPMAPARAFHDRYEDLRTSFAERLPESHRRFLASLAYTHREGDYLFVHAGVMPGVPLDRQDPEDLMWVREPFLYSNDDFGVVVVHGHTPTGEVQERPNRIGIDTGAVYGGRLTALVLDGEARRFLQVPKERPWR